MYAIVVKKYCKILFPFIKLILIYFNILMTTFIIKKEEVFKNCSLPTDIIKIIMDYFNNIENFSNILSRDLRFNSVIRLIMI